MNTLLLAALVAVTSGSQYDQENNLFDEAVTSDWLDNSDFWSSTSFGDVANFELPSAQSNDSLAPPAPVQPVAMQPQNQDNTWNGYNPYQQSVEVPASTTYLSGITAQYTYQPTVPSAAQTFATASNINHMTASSALTSMALLAVDNSQTLAIRSTEQSAVTATQLHPKTSNGNVPSSQVLSATNPARAPLTPAQISGYKAISWLPHRQLIKVLNAVSRRMRKGKILVASTVKITLQTTLERFQELLEQLCQLHESAFSPIPVIPGGVIIDKASVQASLQRISAQKAMLVSKKSNIKKLLGAMTGQDFSSLDNSECYKKTAEVLVSHAMLLYGPIPDVTFDDKGNLTVDGNQFPDVAQIKEYYQQKFMKYGGHAKNDKKDSAVTSNANNSNPTVNNAQSGIVVRTSSSTAPNSHSTRRNRSATSATPGTSSYSLLFGDSAQPLELRSSKDAPKSTSSTSSTELLYGNHSSTSSNITTGPHFNSLFETGIPHGALISTIPIESWGPSATAAFTAPSMAQIRPLEVAQQCQVPTMTSPQMANPVYVAQTKFLEDFNSKKRKIDESAAQPVAKRPKRSTKAENNTVTKNNMRLLINLHNYIAGCFNTQKMANEQTNGSMASCVGESIDALIGMALEKDRKLMTASIHHQYKIDKGFLRAVQEYLDKKPMPAQKQAFWLLNAFIVPNPKPTATGDQLYHIANWYTAVAMSLIETIPNVRFENGRVWVENEPFILKS